MLPMLPQDKANHLVYGAAFAVIGTYCAHQVGVHQPLIPVILAALLGIAKELADWIMNQQAVSASLPPPHSVEFLDFAATACGGVLVALGAAA